MIQIGNQTIEMMDPSELQSNPWNPNSVGVENMEKLKNSLRNNEFFKPVLYRTLSDGTKEIIGGEHRVLAAAELGISVPTLNLGEITDAKAKKLTLMDNDSYGENDATRLATILKDLENGGEDILGEMTYSEEDLSEMLNMTVNTDMGDILDDLEDIDLEAPESEESNTSHDDDDTIAYKTFKVKVPLKDAESFNDNFEALCELNSIEDSDPAVMRGELLIGLLEEANVDPR